MIVFAIVAVYSNLFALHLKRQQHLPSIHGLGSKLLELSHSAGSSLFKSDLAESLRHVNGVLPGHNVAGLRTTLLSLACLHHSIE